MKSKCWRRQTVAFLVFPFFLLFISQRFLFYNDLVASTVLSEKKMIEYEMFHIHTHTHTQEAESHPIIKCGCVYIEINWSDGRDHPNIMLTFFNLYDQGKGMSSSDSWTRSIGVGKRNE